MCTVGDGIISEIRPCKGKLPSERVRDAAPKLLEALEAALKTAEFENHPFRPWREQARAAIAAAKGE